jgi:hypothetical protein
MKKTLIRIVFATAMLFAAAGNAFADGHRGGWGHRDFDRGYYHRDFYPGYYHRQVWIAPPCRDRVIVCPPRAAIIIGPFAIFGY